MASSVLVSLIVLLSFYGFQVDGKVDRYAFSIVENGTSVNEQVEVDVEKQTEVIRVPQHNDAEAVEVLNDFEAGLSARRLPATKDCYVSKLDSSVSFASKNEA
ncbi:response to bacterium [Desmophyllum pertusum]|uniref:Response to bacterium n=1 Tax=Desmophyllum pertusum TaxID=174260 RepID=A0A9W9YAD1_9CNID|nr:response to bacterium [Desmophyllum pertusum]